MARTLTLTSLVLLLPTFVWAETNAAEEAVAAYQRGLDLQGRDPNAAREQFSLAVQGYQQLIDAGHANAPLFCNLGHACLMSGETGAAVHYYRRAEQLDPGNAAIQAGLLQAGKQAMPRAAWDLERHLGAWPALGVGLGMFLLGWLCVLAAWRTRRRWLLVSALPLLVTGLMLAGSIAKQGWYEHRYPAGVVIKATPLREGNGSSFRAVVANELPGGAEFRTLVQKDEWLRVQLADGTRGWVERQATLLNLP